MLLWHLKLEVQVEVLAWLVEQVEAWECCFTQRQMNANYLTCPKPPCCLLPVAQVSICVQVEVRRCYWGVYPWFDLCVDHQFSGIKNLCYDDFSLFLLFFLMLFMGEVQCGVIKQRTLKLRSAYWRQWNSYLPLIKSTLFRKCSWEVVLWSDCLLHFQGNHRASPLLLPSRRSVQCLLMQDHFS